MLPIILDLARYRVLLIGESAAAARRLASLDKAGARDIGLFAPKPGAALASAAGSRLVRRLPERSEIAAARLVFLADRAAPYVTGIAATARAAGALLHIEDDPAASDFSLPAVLRRGDLAIAVSTGGASPALAVGLRDRLAEIIGPDWESRTKEIAALRREWRSDGADGETLKRRTREWLGRQPSTSPTNPERRNS
jgi:precorrin-2 dehydrogenase